jgi:RNA polymerase sigma-70 factor (ECF subfamily)
MDNADRSAGPEDRLSELKTEWTLLFRAHGGLAGAAAATRELLLRYYGAAYRYLLGTVRDAAAAEELTQEFAVRFLRGDFQRADPGRGRFRDYLKTALRHLVQDYWRRQKKEPPLPFDSGLAEGAESAAPDDPDPQFLEKWREELLAQAWEALRAEQERTGSPYHTLLRWRADEPEARSAELAGRLRAQRGGHLTEAGVRQLLHRARQRFADLLVDEVAHSLPGCTPAELEQELIDLGLLEYCRAALLRRRPS